MILSFDKSKKARSTKEHNDMFSSDSGINGTYVPNMSDDDKNRWKAKHIKGDDERIEIRRTINGTQLLIVVYKKEKYISWSDAVKKNRQLEYAGNHRQIHISMNSKLQLTSIEYVEMTVAIEEAKNLLCI